MEMLENGDKVAVSIAPSFASVYSGWKQSRIPSALRVAGFSFISQTSIGAYQVAYHTAKHIEKNPDQMHVCSSCPVVVSYIEKYSTDHLRNLIPLVSPMVAHARMLKAKLPDYKVVFFGPCIAKIKESLRPEARVFVDAALTFENLETLLHQKGILLEACEDSGFDESPIGDSGLFPLEGGILKTANITTDILAENILSVSGSTEFIEALEIITNNKQDFILEPLFCNNGCINGPAIGKKTNVFTDRAEIISYNRAHNTNQEIETIEKRRILTYFRDDSPKIVTNFKESQIWDVLNLTGKENIEHELNCGACGYNTCRDKAIAVLQGIAEVEMCMPFMRRLAEKKTDLLLEKDPNGIVILDNNLCIQNMNPAFKKMFVCSDKLINTPISYLVDTAPFEKLLAGKSLVKEEVSYSNYNMICHLFCYRIQEQNQVVGIFVDVTDFHQNKEKLQSLKVDTIIQANELIEHQINMAQQFAMFLGENTAKGEVLLQKLIEAIKK